MAHVPSRYTIREVLIVKRFICVCLFFLLILTAAFADDTPTLRIWGAYYDESIQSYASAGHNIDFRYSSFVDIAAAIASKNPDVDVFIFETYSGLDQIKKLNYYLPLPEDSTFQEHLNNLYPAFQLPLLDDNHIIGWYADAQPLGWRVLSPHVLDDAGVSAPHTFEELLDACNALIDDGILGRDYLLISEYPYTPSGMLSFFIEQFIIASERVDGQVNFLRPEFSRMTAKIKEIVPENIKENRLADYELFTTTMVSFTPATDMELIPSVLDDAPSSLYYIADIAIINPYSNNIDGAIDLMRYLAAWKSDIAYLWDSSLSKPIIRPDYDEKVAQYQAEIARLEAKENRTTQDEDDLDRARRSLAYITENPYSVSPEDIAYYQNLVQYAYIPGDSPVTFDDALKTLMQRYLNGAFDAEGFARACQEHVNTVYLEMGLTPMYVPN